MRFLQILRIGIDLLHLANDPNGGLHHSVQGDRHFALHECLGLVLPEALPDYSTMSRMRRLIDVETDEAVFTWILQRLADAGLLRGKTVAIDATTLVCVSEWLSGRIPVQSGYAASS